MNIYLVKTNDNWTYDEYDLCIVFAASPKEAREVAKRACFNFSDNLTVKKLGENKKRKTPGLIFASYNEG